jgi:hypothetical protein
MTAEKKLISIPTTVMALGHNLLKPSEYFMAIAHTISKRPAMKTKSHATGNSLIGEAQKTPALAE